MLKVSVLVLLLAPAGVLSIMGFRQTERDLTRLATERRAGLADLAASSLQGRLDRVTDVTAALANGQGFREAVAASAWDEALARVSDARMRFPYMERITLYTPEGVLMADTNPSSGVLGQDFSYRDWYRGVSAAWEPYVSDVFQRMGLPVRNVVFAAAPVRDLESGEVIGIIALQIVLDTFSSWSLDVDVGPAGFIYIVDRKGQVVYHPYFPPQEKIVDLSSVPAVQRALSGVAGVAELYNPVEEEMRLSAWAPVPGYGWGIVVAQPSYAAFAERSEALMRLLLRDGVFMLILLVSALIVLRLLDRLDRQLQRERTFLGSLGEGVVVTDKAGTIAYMNPAGLRIFRLAPEDTVGKSWLKIAADPTDLKGAPIPAEARAFHGAQRGETVAVSYRYRRRDGTTFPALVTTAPIVFEGRVIGVINVFRDITKETELEHERAELLSIASHQMRTPLTAMRWTTEMLLRGEAGKLSREQRGLVNDLLENNGRLTGLVNDMLNVARLEAGQLAAAPGATDLTALLKEAAREVAPIAKEKKQALETRLPRKAVMLPLDARMFKQAVLNLLSNAIKYTPERGRVLLEAVANEDVVHVRVQDSGIGIPADQQDRLFNKFFRAENAIASGAEGTGLGLYVVKKIVEQAGGTIAIESAQGQGSTFTVTLPLKRA